MHIFDTIEQAQAFAASNPAAMIVVGNGSVTVYAPGDGGAPNPCHGVTLGEDRAAAVDRIKEAAEMSRCCTITCTGPGKTLEYVRKIKEAEAIRIDANPTAAEYPMLAAGLEAKRAMGDATATLLTVADEIEAAHAVCLAHGAAVSRIEQETCLRLEAATTVAEVQQVEAGVVWPVPEV